MLFMGLEDPPTSARTFPSLTRKSPFFQIAENASGRSSFPEITLISTWALRNRGNNRQNRARQVFGDKLIPVLLRDVRIIKDNNDIINAGGIQIETVMIEAIVL
jgi:hypothetical protein